MSNRIQLQLENSLAELRDYDERQIFTRIEISEIVKRRTAFEQRITRKAVTEADYIAYYEYQSQLDQLRRLRLGRAIKKRKKSNETKTSLADYALRKSNVALLRRGTRRFPQSEALWKLLLHELQAVSYAATSRAYVAYIAADPMSDSRWIQAATFEFTEGDVAIARKLFMRATRLLSHLNSIWEAWIIQEIQFTEKLTKRWEILGLHGSRSDKAQEDSIEGFEIDLDNSLEGLPINEELSKKVDQAALSQADSEENAVISGQVVKLIISHAIEALSSKNGLQPYTSLLLTIQSKPSQLTSNLIEHIYDLLSKNHPSSSRAKCLIAERPAFLSAADSIDAIQAVIKNYNALIEVDADVYASYMKFLVSRLDLKNKALVKYLLIHIEKLHALAEDSDLSSAELEADYLKALYLSKTRSMEEVVELALEASTETYPESEQVAGVSSLVLCSHPIHLSQNFQSLSALHPFSPLVWEPYLNRLHQFDVSSIPAVEDAIARLYSLPESDPAELKTDLLCSLFALLILFTPQPDSLTKKHIIPITACRMALRKYPKELDLSQKKAIHAIICASAKCDAEDAFERIHFLYKEAGQVKEAMAAFEQLRKRFSVDSDLSERWARLVDS